MNETDIKKCIKNGFCWNSYGKKPEREMGFGKGGDRGKNWPLFLTGSPENYHATYAAAKLAISTRREQARVDARKADGTQVTLPETPEQRDARLKAAYEGYCKAGGPITKEQLTEEMREWCKRNKISYWTGVSVDGTAVYDSAEGFPIEGANSPYPEQCDKALVFWAFADADHDHFLRTWKGPLTEGAAKKLRKGDKLFVAVNNGTVGFWTHTEIGGPLPLVRTGRVFLSESEAKQAAHDLWLADRRENQLEAITEEQRKMLHKGDVIYIRSIFDAIAVKVNGDSDQISVDAGCYFFSAKAALDKAKQPEHKFADMPEWCPPLPEGYVPLGMGETFRINGRFIGARSMQSSPNWEDGEWTGGVVFIFYAAPRDSEIAILNYPWLADEKSTGTEPELKPIIDSAKPHESLKVAETNGASKPREWQDIPQPLAPRKTTQTVLEEAMKCVGGPRRRDYGTPDENFGRIADLWSVHLKGKLSKPVTPDDVAMMMILLKVVRQANSPKRDNLVDIAGYAQCASELKEGK